MNNEQYTQKLRKNVLDKINSLSTTEHEEILKIVKKHNVSFSQNKNGVFFNLSVLQHDIVSEIDQFVNYCLSNKKELDEYDKIITECKLNNKLDGIIPVINTSLCEMSKSARQEVDTSIDAKIALSKLKVDATTMDKFIRFADKVTHEKDKLCKKKINIKFNNAKKKFAKKSDKKFDVDIKDVLEEDKYILT